MIRVSVLYPRRDGARFPKGVAAHGKEIMGDIPNYTDIAPQIQISEIVG